jgi:hypothetical protein
MMAAVACAAALTASGTAPAQTDNYPVKTVRIIAPFPPGGTVDFFARVLAPKLAESLGQQFIVDNRTGAAGTIGTELAARSAPDGYTLLVNTIPLVTNTLLFNRVPYDALNDFAPIMLLASSASGRGRTSLAAGALGPRLAAAGEGQAGRPELRDRRDPARIPISPASCSTISARSTSSPSTSRAAAPPSSPR